MPDRVVDPVSPREQEVLGAVAQHLTNAEIAHRLHLSIRTVESHVSSLLRKLGARDRRELAALAAGTTVSEAPVGAPAYAGFPTPRTPLVGRAEAVEAVARLATRSRVTTVVGPGGAGKTRLVGAAAAQAQPWFASGEVFVDLVPVAPGAVDAAVAGALGVTQRPGVSVVEAVAAALRGRMLLVLDNAEHVLDDVARLVGDLVDTLPDLHVLVTSRERLAVPGEAVFHLGPLEDDEATALFTTRAQAATSDFDPDPVAVVALCRRLDGSPLAIELAAARVASLGLEGVEAGLDEPLRLLALGRPADRRHRSLRAVVEWSHDALDDDERAVLRRVSVFAGGFDLVAATAVADVSRGAAADLLGRLADKSLVRRAETADGASRWALLVGVRELAAERLAAGDDAGSTRDRYAAWAASRAAALAAVATARASALDVADPAWAADVDAVVDDLRACVTAGAGGRGFVRDVAVLVYARGFVAEAGAHYRTAAALAPSGAAAAADLADAAACAHLVMDAGEAYALLCAAADAARGDDRPTAGALAAAVTLAERFRGALATPPDDATVDRMRAEAETLAGSDGDDLGAVAVARAWTSGADHQQVEVAAADRAVHLARAGGDALVLSAALDARSTAAALAGEPDTSLRLSSERFDLLDGQPAVRPQVAVELVDAVRSVGSYALATGRLAEALDASRCAADHPSLEPHPCWAKGSAVLPLALTGDLDAAEATAREVWAEVEATRRFQNPQLGIPFLAAVLAAGLRGEDAAVTRWLDRVATVTGRTDQTGSPNLAPLAAYVHGRIALADHDLGGDTDLGPARAALAGSFVRGRFDGYAVALAAELAVVAGATDADRRLADAERYAPYHRWAAATVARARARRTSDPALLDAAARAWVDVGATVEAAATRALGVAS